MNCPNCGYPRAKYDVSRKALWKGHRTESSLTRKTIARTDFKAHCPRCGHKWNDCPEGYVEPEFVSTEKEIEEELEETEADKEDEES